MKDSELEKMTLKELRELKGRIDDAIRLAIRNKRQPVQGGKQVIDLEKSRDDWLKSRRK